MNVGNIFSIRRRAVALAIAAIVALTATYAPVLLDGVADSSIVTSALACGHQTSGGDC